MWRDGKVKTAKPMIFPVVKHLMLNITLLVACAILIFFMRETFGAIEIVGVLKLASLAILLAVNGEIAVKVSGDRKDVRNINYLIILFVAVTLIFQFLKILDLQLPESGNKGTTILVFEFLKDNIFWISTFPIFMYTALDFYIAFAGNSDNDERLIAKLYIMFVDVPIVFPLLVVLALSSILLWFDPSSVEQNLFISGSMAIIIISSSVATKAVNEMQERLVAAAKDENADE